MLIVKLLSVNFDNVTPESERLTFFPNLSHESQVETVSRWPGTGTASRPRSCEPRTAALSPLSWPRKPGDNGVMF